MPSLRGKDENVIAIFLADIHLSLRPSIWRSAEPDWLEAQARPLLEIQGLQRKYGCPVICAGDIFDKWNCSPELINWAMDYLPNNMHAVPGQHDLPLHQYEDIYRSVFQTLAKAGKIVEITGGLLPLSNDDDKMLVCGFPFGVSIESRSYKGEKLCIAVVHDYVWIAGYGYPSAPDEKRITDCTKRKICNGKFYGYDIIVYGDNHKGFQTKEGETIIFNCGTLMRRKSDEIDYKPQVGLLLETGEVVPYYLDISEDKHLDAVDMALKEEQNLDMTDFIDGLEKLGATALDFRDAMRMFLYKGKTSVEAKEIILKAMEK